MLQISWMWNGTSNGFIMILPTMPEAYYQKNKVYMISPAFVSKAVASAPESVSWCVTNKCFMRFVTNTVTNTADSTSTSDAHGEISSCAAALCYLGEYTTVTAQSQSSFTKEFSLSLAKCELQWQVDFKIYTLLYELWTSHPIVGFLSVYFGKWNKNFCIKLDAVGTKWITKYF